MTIIADRRSQMNNVARLSLVASLTMALMFPAGAQSLRKVKLTQSVASFDFMSADYARLTGIFAAEGLEVEQIATRGAGPDLAALVSGDVEFNLSPGVNQINAIIGKRDVITVANIVNRSLIGVVLSKEAADKSGVKSDAPLKQRAAALSGLTLGMTQPGSLTDRQFQHLGRLAGLKDGEIKTVALGGAPSIVAAFERKQVDGYAIATPFDRIEVAKGAAVMWVDNAKGDDSSIDPFMMTDVHTSRAFADKNKEVVRAFIRALRRATQEIKNKSTEDVIKAVQPAFPNVTPEVMALGINALKLTLNPSGTFTMEMAKNTLRLDGRPDVTPEQLFATYDPSFQN
jgi:NitT/TauT family transport system substrate-binding protein